MRLLTGTSGYAYPQWRGTFYPAELKDDEMLGSYAARLPAVEINNTFYRIPKPDVVETWRRRVPPDFAFVIKASQRISHRGKLRGEEALGSLRYLYSVLEPLGSQLAAVLVQTPPFLRADLGVLADFVQAIPAGQRVAFELPHPSWHQADTDRMLLERGHCRVVADKEDGSALWPELGSWAYVRLRRDDYPPEVLAGWLRELEARALDTAYVFFKHEDTARGAELALELAALTTP